MTALTRLTPAGVPGRRRRRRTFSVGTTPTERTFTVPAETRVFAVEAEERVFTVAAETRVFAVPAEDRTIIIPPEDRTFEV